MKNYIKNMLLTCMLFYSAGNLVASSTGNFFSSGYETCKRYCKLGVATSCVLACMSCVNFSDARCTIETDSFDMNCDMTICPFNRNVVNPSEAIKNFELKLRDDNHRFLPLTVEQFVGLKLYEGLPLHHLRIPDCYDESFFKGQKAKLADEATINARLKKRKLGHFAKHSGIAKLLANRELVPAEIFSILSEAVGEYCNWILDDEDAKNLTKNRAPEIFEILLLDHILFGTRL